MYVKWNMIGWLDCLKWLQMFWYTVVKIFCICSCDSKSERDVRERFQLHVQWVMQRAGSINYPHPLTTAAVMWTISVLLKDPGKKQLVEDLLFLLSHNQRLWFLSKIKPDNTNFYNHHKPALGCFSEDKFYTKYYSIISVHS